MYSKKRISVITNDILKLFNISIEEIIIIEHDTIINANNLYYNNYDCADYNNDKIIDVDIMKVKELYQPKHEDHHLVKNINLYNILVSKI